MQFRMTVAAFALTLAACQTVAIPPSSTAFSNAVPPAIGTRTCEQRVNDTLAKIEQCIERKSLWDRLAHFQLIADRNSGTYGHPNRDTGTTGYKASVDYVAGLMRAAGYHVTIQQYVYAKSEANGSVLHRGGKPRYPIDRAWLSEIRKQGNGIDYNVIADSPHGDPHNTVVIDAHLDSIYGAGMLDNASGSTSILEVALAMAKTHTRNRLRYIWFGGEELGLLGSVYYTTHLTSADLKNIDFDVDVDVTATPNFDILVADPKNSSRAGNFPPNVVPESRIGNDEFFRLFEQGGVNARAASFGNDGTDSLSFSFVGVPNSGVLTEQDCCKQTWETKLWGGFLGNYEGTVPGDDGGCVDRPNKWCDNLSNNDRFVFELVSRSVAYVTFELANRNFPW
jgi:Peptidase family M28